MAEGKVLIGFSRPFVAVYANNSGTISYSNGQQLARGVSISVEPESSDENIFYADNGAAESAGAVFTGGTATVTVDGLKDAARKLIYGLPAAETATVGTDSVDVYSYNDDMVIPYVGLAYVEMYQEDGAISYVARVLPKVKFNLAADAANTKGEEIEWQTQELTAQIFRDDTAKHNWNKFTDDLTSEEDAVAYIKSVFAIS